LLISILKLSENHNGDSILQEWYDAIKSAESIDKIEEIRIAIFGKKGIMNAEFARMKDIPDAEKGTFAKELNIHKEGLNALLSIVNSFWRWNICKQR
jgi:phenylalanyl-tRNA synthetase alpha subunit